MATIKKRIWTTAKGQSEAWVLAYTDRAGKRHKEQFSSLPLANTRRIEVEGKIDTNAFRAEAKSATVGDVIDAYHKGMLAELAKREVTQMHVVNTAGLLNKHVRPVLGHFKIMDVLPGDVKGLSEDMKAAGVGIPTVRRTVGALKRCFDHARIASLTGDNPAKDISVKAARASGNSRVTPPTKEQYDALVAAADSIRPANTNQPGSLTLRIQFAGRTGLRASELWALRWRNINFKRALVSVSARVDAYAGVEDVTKTQAGERDIDLADELVEALQAWREATAFGADDDFVFPDSKGGTVSHTNFTKREWAKVKKAAGVDIGWHALRHFAISVWIETGFSHKEVQGLAGHSSINVTTTRYGHLFASDDRRARMNKIGL